MIKKHFIKTLFFSLSVLTLVLLPSCGDQMFKLEGITGVELTSGASGASVVVADEDYILELLYPFSNNNFQKLEPSGNSTGWGYRLRFYQDDKMKDEITVMGGGERIVYKNYFYEMVKGKSDIVIDTGFYEKLLTVQLTDVPEMTLEYELDGRTYQTAVKPGASNWNYVNEDGTGTGGVADTPHPLDRLGNMPEITLKGDILIKLTFNFEYPPDSRFIRYWPEEYIGKTDEYAEKYDRIDLGFNGLVVPGDGQKGVYELIAEWPQGFGSYVFYIK